MRGFKDLKGKERAEYIGIIVLYPLFLLFRLLGKNVKWLSTRGKQLTAAALCAALILGVLPVTAFAQSSLPTQIVEFNIISTKVDVKDYNDDFWVYGTNSKVVKRNEETLPETGWNWAIQVNQTKGEYAIKLKDYDGGMILGSSVHLRSTLCKLDFEASGRNTVKGDNFGVSLDYCDVTLHGDGNLNVETKNFTAFYANSLTVNLAHGRTLSVKTVRDDESSICGINVRDELVLNSGNITVNVANNTEKYKCEGVLSTAVILNGGSLNITADNAAEGGKSYGISSSGKYNTQTKAQEYPLDVSFNGGSVEIKGGTVAVNSETAPVAAESLKLFAGKAADKSDKEAYNPDNFKNYTYYTTEHIHCRCGAEQSHGYLMECSYYDSQTYKPWNDPTSLPRGYGKYYLTTDVVLSEQWDMGCEVDLCLNGHSIIADGDFDAIRLSRTLWLSDCSAPEKQGKITHTPGKIGRGIIAEANKYDDGELRMYGGNITGNTAEDGAGLYCGTKGYVIIRGGSITNNTATGNGGGIYNEGNTYIYVCNITGNKANNGGGIYNKKGSDQYSIYDALILWGGTITDNTATEKGGGIYAEHYVTIGGYQPWHDVEQFDNATVVLNNTSGTQGNKKADNVSFATAQFLNFYNNCKGGKVSLHLTGEGTTAAVVYRNLINKFMLYKTVLGNLRCDDSKYTFAINSQKNTVELKKALKDLTAADFNFTAPTGLEYDGNAKQAEVTAKSGINCGGITVKYYDETGRAVTPTNAGTYTVKIDVEENEIYGAASGLTDSSWKFTVNPRPVMPSEILIDSVEQTYIYTGAAIKPAARVTVNGSRLTEGKDFTLSYGNNTNLGKGSVTVTLKGNYSGSRTVEFSITYGHASELMYSMPKANKNGWYNSDVIVTAKQGYTVGEDLQNLSDSLKITGDTGRGGKQIFVKAADGKVYCTILQYKIDTAAPENVTVQYNKSGFRSLLNKLTFGLFFKETVTVEAAATDALSGMDTVMYYASDTAVTDVNDITDWQGSLNITPNSKKYVYVKATDKAGNSVVLLDQGVVAYSESTVTPTSGEFDLKESNRADISFTVNMNGNVLCGIKNGDDVLLNGTDYAVSGNTVTVYKGYFARFAAGTTQTLTFIFNPLGEVGKQDTVTADITIKDTTHYHNSVKHPAKPCTCTEDGNKEYYSCTGCAELFWDAACTQNTTAQQTVLPALHHANAVKTDAVSENCENSGNYAYWHCPDCNNYFADVNVTRSDEAKQNSDVFKKNALGHDWTEWTTVTAADFTHDGKQERTCGRCKIKDYKTVAKTVPVITDGENGSFKLGTKAELSFGTNMPLDENTVISVDGKALENSGYKLGSTNSVILPADYLNTLTTGKHTVSIKTAVGTLQTEFTVIAADVKETGNTNAVTVPEKKDEQPPKTDSSDTRDAQQEQPTSETASGTAENKEDKTTTADIQQETPEKATPVLLYAVIALCGAAALGGGIGGISVIIKRRKK